jgi:DNA-binding transcriptional ArsR family regulator
VPSAPERTLPVADGEGGADQTRRDPGDDLFRMLADPTRRRVLDLLAERGELSVGELAEEFPGLVASGISKHLMALRAAGLVHATRDGRRRRYRIDADALATALAPWLATYERFWTGALERLRDLAQVPAAHR